MKRKVHQEKSLIIWCLICESIAYALALYFRYVVLNSFFSNPTREHDFYKIFFMIVLLMYSVVFHWRKDRRPKTWETGTFGRIMEVIKQHLSLLICLLIFLYFIHWSDRVSRTVMLGITAFGMLLDFIARQMYGKARSQRYIRERREEQVLLVSLPEEGERLQWSINRYGYRNEEKEIFVRCHVDERVELSERGLEKVLHRMDVAAREKGQHYDMIFVSAGAAKQLGETDMKQLESRGIPICRGLEMDEKGLSTVSIADVGGSAAVYQSLMTRKCPVLGVEYTTASKAEVAAHLIRHTEEVYGKYVCFSNVHTTVMAADDAQYRAILNGSAFTFPDGNPVAEQIWKQGFIEAERVAGPDLMSELFRRSMESGRKHFFYGSSEKTLAALKERLKENYPWMEVAGMYSPPFRPLTEEEDAQVVQMINDSGADFVWIGLGAPKQERWMAEHKDRIHGVMLGVGAGFDFHAGTTKRAPVLVQKMGLEWLYRLLQDPGRLLKRYLITNTKFILYTHTKK